MGLEPLMRRVEELVSIKRVKLGFGLQGPDTEILQSLKVSSRYADITLVGPPAISGVRGFPVLVDERPEERLAATLVNGDVEGIVRGTIDDFKTREAYTKLTGEPVTTEISLLEDPTGRQFFVAPLSNPEGWTKEERLHITVAHATSIADWGVVPDIAVFSGMRHETYQRKKDVQQGITNTLVKTYQDAEWIVAELSRQGFSAKHWAIDLNLAVEAGANILIPVNGMVGNQIFRVLLFCGGKVLTATPLGLSHFYEDCSRTEKNFAFHVKWITAQINKGK
ncbi:MAG: hypothetical protein HYZ09_02710 [Candidatus Kerfeldbacteria bacterium]|nr:hypothetical protein [Candidatus Kerfeldbacteria bacterium]